jgi:signal transduction histidine kinase/PAS domain-containing protein/DNA-binding NarL/FixJ family response regulator
MLITSPDIASFIIETNSQIIILFDDRFNVLDCNPAAMRFLGFQSKEELKTGLFKRLGLWLPEVQSNGRVTLPIAERLSLAAEKGNDKFETELLMEGIRKTVLIELAKIPYESSFALIAYANDMTEIRDREDDLIHAQNINNLHLTKLNAVIDATKIGMYDVGIHENDFLHPDNTFEFTDEFRRMLGYTNEIDFPNTFDSWGDRLHPEDKKKALEAVVRHISDISGETPYDEEYRLMKKDGEYTYFRACGEAVRDKDGNAIRIAGALMDIGKVKNTIIHNELQLAKISLINKAARIGLWDMETIRDDIMNVKNIIQYSDEFREILGYNDENDFPNVINSFNDCLSADVSLLVTNALNNHIMDTTGKTPFFIEYQAKKKNSEPVYIRATGESIRDENGNAIRTLGTIMDITEEKNALKHNELQLTKLNLLHQAAKNALWEMEVTGDDLTQPEFAAVWSDDFRHLLGFEDKNDFPDILDSWNNCIHPDDKEKVFRNFDLHLYDKTGKTPYEMEFRVIKKNGESAYFRDICATIRDADGNPLRIIGSVTDITEQKQVAEAMAKQKMKEAELHTQAFISKFSLPFTRPYDFDELMDNALFDLRDFTGTDRAIILEYQPDGFLHCTYENVINTHTQKVLGRSLVYEDVKSILDEAEKTGCFYEKEAARYFKKYPAADLGEKSFCYIPLMIEGERAGYLVFFTMFEKANWAEGEFHLATMAGSIIAGAYSNRQHDKLKEEAMKAKEANLAKTNFLAHMSHEIRTPMNAILGAAEIQLQKNTNPPDAEEAFYTIYNSGNLLLGIINDVLDLSRIESGRIEIVAAKYDIPSIIYDTVHLNLMRYESKNLQFDLKIDEHTPLNLFGDEMRIKQILNNILSNAFKYTEKGRVELSVSAVAEDNQQDDCTLILRISDTGQGMTEEQLGKVFDEYERFNLDVNRSIVGTGLGMHITKRLIESMDGEIFAESEPGKGSVFTVLLPQKKENDDVCGAGLAEKLRFENFKIKSKLNQRQIVYEHMPYGSVLIVDDVETNLYVAKGMMLPYGLKIETAVSGFEAVEKIKRGSVYSVIFMDYMMPKMNGIEATKIIRDRGYTHPVIALTANAVAGSSEMFMENGFDGFISKPIDIRELNTQLNRFIRDKQPPEVIEFARRQTANLTKNPFMDAKFTSTILRSLKNAITALETLYPPFVSNTETDIDLYTITVHGMNGALANIGETDLSNTAKKLEQAGINKDTTTIISDTPAFIDALKRLSVKYTPEETTEKNATDDIKFLREKFTLIKKACETYDIIETETALNDLKRKTWSNPVNTVLNEIAENLLRGNLKEVIVLIQPFCE